MPLKWLVDLLTGKKEVYLFNYFRGSKEHGRVEIEHGQVQTGAAFDGALGLREDFFGTTECRVLKKASRKKDRYFMDTKLRLRENGSSLITYKKFIKQLQKKPAHNALVVSPMGGAGKTTLLIRLQKWIQKRPYYPRPFYVELKDCKDGLFTKISSEHRIQKERLISPTRQPRYLALLDGINEATNFGYLHDELCEYFKSGNLAVVTTRYDAQKEYFPLKRHARVYDLTLPDTEVDSFFKYFKLNPTEEVRSILKTPLLLDLYRHTSQTLQAMFITNDLMEEMGFRVKKEDPTTVGDVLWNYYCTELLKAKVLDSEKNKGVSNRMVLIKNFLPLLAHSMCEKGTLVLSVKEVEEKAFEIGVSPACVRDILCLEAAILKESGTGFTFLAEEMKDFFAAVFLWNSLGVALSSNPVHRMLYKSPIRVRQLFADIIDEGKVKDIAGDLEKGVKVRSSAFILLGDVYFFNSGIDHPTTRQCSKEESDNLLDKALSYYEEAANLGDPYGDWSVGFAYRKKAEIQPIGSPERTLSGQLAFDSTQKAYINGLPEAMNSMGILYKNGIGVVKDIDKAIECFKQGIEAGDANAYNNLGNIYETFAKEQALLGNMKKAKGFFIEAFKVFYFQSLSMSNEYGLNRLSCYFYEGLPASNATEVEACKLLGVFNVNWLPNEKEYMSLKNNTRNVFRNIQARAVNTQNKYAIERQNYIKDRES